MPPRRICAHPRIPENRNNDGRCKLCHRQRSLERWRQRGKQQRTEREAMQAARDARVMRTKAIVAAGSESSLDARRLYHEEKAKRLEQGKRVLPRRSA